MGFTCRCRKSYAAECTWFSFFSTALWLQSLQVVYRYDLSRCLLEISVGTALPNVLLTNLFMSAKFVSMLSIESDSDNIVYKNIG